MDNEILKELKNKEREIYSQLQASMLFRQWEGIKSTILLYESNNVIQSDIKTEFAIPADYSSDLTWADKFLFGLNRISEGTPEDVTEELMKFETNEVKDLVFKKMRAVSYSLLDQRKIKILKKVGRKNKFVIKQ